MKVKVLLFGGEAQAVGRSSLVVEVPDPQPTCGDVFEALMASEPKLGPTRAHCRLAVNHGYAPDDQRVRPGDEIALIGMVSGG